MSNKFLFIHSSKKAHFRLYGWILISLRLLLLEAIFHLLIDLGGQLVLPFRRLFPLPWNDLTHPFLIFPVDILDRGSSTFQGRKIKAENQKAPF